MRFIKKFEKFLEEAGSPQIAPSKPSPTTKPTTRPGKPETRPSKPGPIPRTRPSVSPDPKAKSKTATAEDVANRFISLMDQEGEDVKNYATKYGKK